MDEDGLIEISIHDTGPGLPLGKVDHRFDAFFTTKLRGSAYSSGFQIEFIS